ncbi:MAG: hypothetical protein ACI304_03540 [Lepagella sp.]
MKRAYRDAAHDVGYRFSASLAKNRRQAISDRRKLCADLVTPCPVGFTDLPKVAVVTESAKELVKADCSMLYRVGQ